MLKTLYIKNYALIEELKVDFASGLNTITGETGAGKSILLGALGLIMGQRADSKAVKTNADKCIIEANFDISAYALKSFFEEFDLEYEAELCVRREVSSNGKSRAFVNDSPLTLDVLEQLMVQLIDIHQQFDTLAIFKSSYQLTILDALAKNDLELASYRDSYTRFKHTEKALNAAKQEQDTTTQALEYNQFLLSELNTLAPKANEYEDLSSEIDVLSNVEEIKRVAQMIYGKIDQTDYAISNALSDMIRESNHIASKDKRFEGIAQRLESTREELNDIGNEAEGIFENIELDPKRLIFIQDRLGQLHKALKKHSIDTTDQLVLKQQELAEKVAQLGNMDKTIANLEKEFKIALEDVSIAGQVLSKKRLEVCGSLGNNITEELALLGMKNANFEVVHKATQPSINGLDEVSFVFNANKGGKLLPLKDAASGGELSRLILVIKTIIAKSIHLPTMIFDEIDTGVSGEIAIRMGILLKSLTDAHQVISITHSPHIAALGDQHMYVYKQDDGDQTKSYIKILQYDERVNELAKMLGGNPPSAAAIANAKELLDRKLIKG